MGQAYLIKRPKFKMFIYPNRQLIFNLTKLKYKNTRVSNPFLVINSYDVVVKKGVSNPLGAHQPVPGST